MSETFKNAQPYALPAEGGTRLVWFGSTIRMKASCAELGATEVVISPGEEPPLHVHHAHDEWFYLIEGEMTFHVGNENFRGHKGAFVFFPRRIPHTFTVESASAHFLVFNTPGGFEKMFTLGPKTPEEAEHAMTAHGMTIVGPHPRQTAAA